MAGCDSAPKQMRGKIHEGLWIAVFGPDGAGKSTLVDRMTRQLASSFRAVGNFHFRPGFRRRRKNTCPVTNPHDQVPRSALISVFKLLCWLADCWFGYLINVCPARLSAKLLIFDRYCDDILVDPLRYRLPQSCIWFAKLVVSLAPRPDLYILLDVPSNIAQQRKSEVSAEESVRQRLAYLLMFQTMPNALVVDATEPIDEVVRRASAAVLGYPSCSLET